MKFTDRGKRGAGRCALERLQAHEIVALEDNSETMPVYLHGIPEVYEALPLSELGGTIDRTITIPLGSPLNPAA